MTVLPKQAQIPMNFGYCSAAGSSDFLIAPCNRDAVGWVDRWPNWPSPALFIFGPAGSGKSHLANIWCERSGADKFLIENLTFDLAANSYFEKNILIDTLTPPFDELAFLHFFNALAERGRQLLIVAELPPARWTISLADLRSRLHAAPAVGIGMPDDGLVGAVMLKQFADRQLNVDPEVLTFLLARMERSFEAVGKLVAAIDEAALIEKRTITIPFAKKVLGQLMV